MAIFTKFLETGPTLHLASLTTQSFSDDTRLLNRLAVLVGLVAIGLPIILWLGANVPGHCMRQSISHFYYAQFMGSIFVGLLFFIGGFLIAYTGDHWLETTGSNIAGLGAFGVALFPTTGMGCTNPEFLARVFVTVQNSSPPDVSKVPTRGYFELFEGIDNFHEIAAGTLFVYLGLFCLIALKRIIPTRHMVQGALLPTKAKRNRYYSACGIVILLCVATLAFSGKFGPFWSMNNLTFYVETIALWAFGIAWFIKGRMFEALND
jgi:hypothetical protein